jgi:hypothetical protein
VNIKHQMLVTMLIAINDVLSLNNSKFGGYIDRIYPYRIYLDMYTPYVSVADMLLHINGKCTMVKSKLSLL